MSERLNQLKKLHEADPSDPFLTYGIALEHGKAGELEEAVHWLDQTLSLDEHYHYAYFQKGKMLAELGRDDEARTVLREGISQARAAGDAKAEGELNELLESVD